MRPRRSWVGPASRSGRAAAGASGTRSRRPGPGPRRARRRKRGPRPACRKGATPRHAASLDQSSEQPRGRILSGDCTHANSALGHCARLLSLPCRGPYVAVCWRLRDHVSQQAAGRIVPLLLAQRSDALAQRLVANTENLWRTRGATWPFDDPMPGLQRRSMWWSSDKLLRRRVGRAQENRDV